MINEKMQDALNRQLNAELYSSCLYLSMSAYFESISLKGFANWMRVQAQEELSHAMRFYDYIHQRGGRVILTSVEAPQTKWDSPLQAFEHVFAHEQKVTGLINGLVNLAGSEADQAAAGFLQWFVAEQEEEESAAEGIVQKLKLSGYEQSGFFSLDQELGKRLFSPAQETE